MGLRFKNERDFQRWLKETDSLRMHETADLHSEQSMQANVDNRPAHLPKEKHIYYNVEMWVLTAVCLVIIVLVIGGYLP